MRASFVDLRTRSREILRALRRNERVTLFYRGKAAAVMHPVPPDNGEAGVHGASGSEAVKVGEHPAFGMWAGRDDQADVAAHVRNLRRGRLDAG